MTVGHHCNKIEACYNRIDWLLDYHFETSGLIYVAFSRRAESYRPRNPYRNRFDGNGMSLVGATPKAQRPSPRPREWEAATQILDDEAGSAGWEESGQKHVRRRCVTQISTGWGSSERVRRVTVPLVPNKSYLRLQANLRHDTLRMKRGR